MDRNAKIWLSSPHMGGTEMDFIKEAFATNWIAPLGPHVDGFEAELERYNRIGHVAALSSGTAAIHLALILLGVEPGDEVICQSLTFSASANPIVYQGATPIFVDSEPKTWNMNPYHLEEAIEDRLRKHKKPKAIIPVHLYGMPANMEEILSIANYYEIAVVEDAAEALGAHINGKKCGTFGDFGVLSFNGNKIITTSGGGALLSENEDSIGKARFLATQARDQAPHYQHSYIGYNYRMSNIVAAIGLGQMEVIEDRVAKHREIFERYNAYFALLNQQGYNIEMQREPEGHFSNRWLSTILLDPKKNRGISNDTLRHALEAKNIESRPVWKPMHLQPVFADSPYYGEDNAEKLFNNGLCLPSGSNLTTDQFNRIFQVFDELFTSGGSSSVNHKEVHYAD